MPQVITGKDGSLELPVAFLRRRGLTPDTKWWLDQRDVALILLPRLPNLRKLYVEPTTACNLNCRTCIRNVWQDPQAHMEMGTFEQLLCQTQEFPDLSRVVFGGLGEPLAHPRFLDMVRLARQQGLEVTIGSNGLLLDRRVSRELVALGVDRLVVSLDGVEPETCASVRGELPNQVLKHSRPERGQKGTWFPGIRNEVRDFNFPSCPDCDLRDSCDLREQNEGCWGWNPSCADCLWTQDIIRCP